MKPAVGTMSSLTWLSRGTYASARKAIETYRNEGRRISTKLFDTTLSTQGNEQLQLDHDEAFSSMAKTAAAKSGFHPTVCQHILDEFEKIRTEYEQNMAHSMKKKKSISNFFTNAERTIRGLSPNRRPNSE